MASRGSAGSGSGEMKMNENDAVTPGHTHCTAPTQSMVHPRTLSTP